LLEELSKLADDAAKRAKGWPTTPRALGSALRRIAPNLWALGVEVTFDRAPGGIRRRLIALKGRPTERPDRPDDADGTIGTHDSSSYTPEPVCAGAGDDEAVL
jgi:hypothetical protein